LVSPSPFFYHYFFFFWRQFLPFPLSLLSIEITFLEKRLYILADSPPATDSCYIYFLKKLNIGTLLAYNRLHSHVYSVGCGAAIVPKCPMLWISADIYSKFFRYYMISMSLSHIYIHLCHSVHANLSHDLFHFISFLRLYLSMHTLDNPLTT
jgi:hypothetical protein